MKPLTVTQENELLSYLVDSLPDWPKKRIKQHLKFGSILVNGQIRTQFNYAVKPGDIVTFSSEKKPLFQKILRQSAIQPVFEDKDLLVIDKPPGLLTIANARTRTETLYYKITDYIRAQTRNKESRVFIVHRLDQDVSGLIVFAKNEETKYTLQDNWEKVEKKYYAIVEGVPKEKNGEIKSYLTEDASHRVYSVPKNAQGKFAVTQYKTLKQGLDYSLLEILLITGRKNQIRAHLSELGCPIVGDEKYRAQTDPIHRVCLHSFYLSFSHPTTGQKLTFETPLPPAFQRIV